MIILAVLLAGLIGIMVIISAAYSATINYQNNQLKREVSALEGEVESLEIEIQSANNIAEIQSRAEGELGMAYPGVDQLVLLSQTAGESTVGQSLRATTNASL